MKKLLLALVVLIVLAVAVLAALNFLFDKKKTKTQAVSGKVTAVVVKSDNGDVNVVSGSGPASVRETRHYLVFKKPTVKQTLEGGVLTLDADCDIPLFDSIPGTVVKCYSDLDVTVPEGVDVTVQTDSGDVKVSLGGHPLKIVAKSDSGDVDVAVPSGHYAIDAKSHSGKAKTVGVTNTPKSPKSIEATSDSGDVKVHAR
jgi:hypothetical protein